MPDTTATNSPAQGTVRSHGIPLHKRSGPGTDHQIVGSVPDGTTVTIVCQTTGTTETGDFGQTDLWDKLDDGTYVSDAFVYTGTNAMVAPPCDGVQPAGGGWGSSSTTYSANQGGCPEPSTNPYYNLCQQYGQKYDIPPGFLSIQQFFESSWNPDAVSPTGAFGLTQFEPGAAHQYGVQRGNIPSQVAGQAHYMADLYNGVGSKTDLALAAYNAGLGNVRKYNGVPPFSETQDYVKKIMGAWVFYGST